jgi:hypothetical protein
MTKTSTEKPLVLFIGKGPLPAGADQNDYGNADYVFEVSTEIVRKALYRDLPTTGVRTIWWGANCSDDKLEAQTAVALKLLEKALETLSCAVTHPLRLTWEEMQAYADGMDGMAARLFNESQCEMYEAGETTDSIEAGILNRSSAKKFRLAGVVERMRDSMASKALPRAPRLEEKTDD